MNKQKKKIDIQINSTGKKKIVRERETEERTVRETKVRIVRDTKER